jgi:hypothetical protein
VTVTALIEAIIWASDRWQASDGKLDLLTLVDAATDALVEGVGGIASSR